MPHTCPNKHWSGCTHAEKIFRYTKSFNKHVAKCNIARKQSEAEEAELRPLMKQVIARLNELEQQVALLKEENRSLRADMRAPTTRGPYEMRGEGETPDLGFGNWSEKVFLDNLQKAEDYSQEMKSSSITELDADIFIAFVFYVANGNTKLVRIGKERDRDGYPKNAELNYRKRRVTVTWDAAVKRIFGKQFLPHVDEMEEILGKKFPEKLARGIRFYARYMGQRPSKRFRDRGSWTAKCTLIMAMAQFYAPRRKIEETLAEEHDRMFLEEYNEEGAWWRQPRVYSMEDVVSYDGFLTHSAQYKEALLAYFTERPERHQEYKAEGGILV